MARLPGCSGSPSCGLNLTGLFGGLLLDAVADAAGVLPVEPGWRPRATDVMSAGLSLQPMAALVGRRSTARRYTLLVSSLVLIFGGTGLAT